MCEGSAQAAGLSAKDTAKAKEARQLYKAGQYEEAANIFLRLSSDYPDMLVLTRNLGACYYYLHRPEPALSNLREYLQRQQNITPEDRREVEGWIAEMEKLRSQMSAIPSAAPVVAPVPPPSVVVPSPSPAPSSSPPLPATPLPPVPSPVAPSTPRPALAQSAPSAPSAAPLPTPPVIEPALASRPSLADTGGNLTGREEALDLRQKPADQGGTAAPESGSRWWLWTGIGAVVAGGIVTGVLLSIRSPGRDGTCSSGLSGCMVVGK
jgi:tetratricopeptide (TPR) repeat protein